MRHFCHCFFWQLNTGAGVGIFEKGGGFSFGYCVINRNMRDYWAGVCDNPLVAWEIRFQCLGIFFPSSTLNPLACSEFLWVVLVFGWCSHTHTHSCPRTFRCHAYEMMFSIIPSATPTFATDNLAKLHLRGLNACLGQIKG